MAASHADLRTAEKAPMQTEQAAAAGRKQRRLAANDREAAKQAHKSPAHALRQPKAPAAQSSSRATKEPAKAQEPANARSQRSMSRQARQKLETTGYVTEAPQRKGSPMKKRGQSGRRRGRQEDEDPGSESSEDEEAAGAMGSGDNDSGDNLYSRKGQYQTQRGRHEADHKYATRNRQPANRPERAKTNLNRTTVGKSPAPSQKAPRARSQPRKAAETTEPSQREAAFSSAEMKVPKPLAEHTDAELKKLAEDFVKRRLLIIDNPGQPSPSSAKLGPISGTSRTIETQRSADEPAHIEHVLELGGIEFRLKRPKSTQTVAFQRGAIIDFGNTRAPRSNTQFRPDPKYQQWLIKTVQFHFSQIRPGLAEVHGAVRLMQTARPRCLRDHEPAIFKRLREQFAAARIREAEWLSKDALLLWIRAGPVACLDALIYDWSRLGKVRRVEHVSEVAPLRAQLANEERGAAVAAFTYGFQARDDGSVGVFTLTRFDKDGLWQSGLAPAEPAETAEEEEPEPVQPARRGRGQRTKPQRQDDGFLTERDEAADTRRRTVAAKEPRRGETSLTQTQAQKEPAKRQQAQAGSAPPRPVRHRRTVQEDQAEQAPEPEEKKQAKRAQPGTQGKRAPSAAESEASQSEASSRSPRDASLDNQGSSLQLSSQRQPVGNAANMQASRTLIDTRGTKPLAGSLQATQGK